MSILFPGTATPTGSDAWGKFNKLRPESWEPVRRVAANPLTRCGIETGMRNG